MQAPFPLKPIVEAVKRMLQERANEKEKTHKATKEVVKH
jgi:hypothetical protein